MPPQHVAILGGGLTGLSSAFHLSRRFPSTRISVLEAAPRLGGWVRSERVKVQHEGVERSVLLEAGPRTIRPGAKSLLELIHLLQPSLSVQTIPKSSSLARNRFLAPPAARGLVALPTSLPALLATPLGRQLLWGVMGEPFRRTPERALPLDEKTIVDPLRASDDDISLEALLTRLSPYLARTLGSAMGHGIYATDARTLSVRAAFPSLWAASERGKGSIVRGMAKSMLPSFAARSHVVPDEIYELGDVPDMMHDASVYTFKGGISTLVDALAENLASKPQVEIHTSSPVRTLARGRGSDAFHVETDNLMLTPTHVVSTLPLPVLSDILPSPSPLPSPAHTKASDVVVLNLIFAASPRGRKPLHPAGFGYLVPRPEGGYAKDALGLLGVVFDVAGEGEDGLVKMTAMVGGPWGVPEELIARSVPATSPKAVDMLLPQSQSFTASPSSPLVQAVLGQIRADLGPDYDVTEPLLARVHVHRAAIPAPQVGHVQRIADMNAALGVDGEWEGRLAVIGAGVGGVSVGDCVEAGRAVGQKW